MEDGALLLERYRVLEPLGEGGSSKVVKALDTKMDRVVAVKIIPAGRKAAVRALREAKTVALLNHPNIVTLYEFEHSEGNYYLIMEFVEGRSLAAVLERFGRLPVELALAIAVQACDALDFAHKNDVIHRDVKPANLRILNDGRVKVMDFGIARLRSAAKSGVTADNEILGTFAYMSPEQASGEIVDERSDVFALGVLIYQMVTGELPFAADTPAGTIYKILNDEPRAPQEYDRGISPALAQVIRKAISKSPDARFSGAGELKTKLELAVDLPGPPAAIVNEMLPDLREPAPARGIGPIHELRRRARSWLRQHEEIITATGFAAGAAASSAWADRYLPLLATDLKLFFPVVIFFSALFLPPAGLAALLALLAAGAWQISPYVGGAAAAIFIVYWLTLGRGFPQLALIPLLSPLLAWLKIPFFLPLAVGMVFSPPLAAFLAGGAALSLGVAEVIGRLDYSWSIGMRPELIPLRFSRQLNDLARIAAYFRSDPWILGQAAVWAAAAMATSAVKDLKTRPAFWLALALGAAGLGAGYRLIPAYFNVEIDFARFFLQPIIFSLIILVALVFILLGPSDKPSRD